MGRSETLALLGGSSVYRGELPPWPPRDDAIRQAVDTVLTGGRWAISGPRRGGDAVQTEFERAWAAYNGVGHAVAVSSGSSALVTAMEALEIGPGDEVIVPVWTWVATASTVLRVGATPVMVDVEPGNFCLSARTVEPAITARTRAVIVVHLHQSMAGMEPLVDLVRRRGLHLIEDCAQAHGALYAGRRAGSFGDLACFSFQQTKPLTSGEGGCVITDDENLARRVFELHADGRRLGLPDPVTGLELVEGSGPMGANHGLTEMQAAILLAQMPGLDAALDRSAANAARLDARLEALAGMRALIHPIGLQRRTVFEYIVSFASEIVARVPVELLGRALHAETGVAWYPSDAPLHRSPLYRPASKRRFAHAATVDAGPFPVADDFCRRSIACHHSVLRGGEDLIDRLVEAFAKVLANLDALEDPAARERAG